MKIKVAHKWEIQHFDQLQSEFLHPVTDDEILKRIAALKNKKPVGTDGIDVKIFKAAAQIVSLLVTNCYKKQLVLKAS